MRKKTCAYEAHRNHNALAFYFYCVQVGWLAGWLADWLAGLAGWLAWLTGLAGWPSVAGRHAYEVS